MFRYGALGGAVQSSPLFDLEIREKTDLWMETDQRIFMADPPSPLCDMDREDWFFPHQLLQDPL